MIYVILGMHKSGTTLLSQILHHSGISMGNFDAGLSYDRGNKYERQDAKELNEEILKAKGINSVFISPPKPLQATEEQRASMRQIIRRCNHQHENWGFKDPRTCLTYPIWASELPEHKIITICRSHDELWQRYRPKRFSRYREPYIAWKFINAWYESNLNILNYLKYTNVDFLVLNYRELMTGQTEFNRLQEFVGPEIILDDRRKPSLYRNLPKKTFLMEVTTRWLARKTGLHANEIISQVEALQQSRHSLNFIQTRTNVLPATEAD